MLMEEEEAKEKGLLEKLGQRLRDSGVSLLFKTTKPDHLAVLAVSQTTLFRIFQTESLQTIISNLMEMTEGSPKGWKTLWEME